MPLTREQIGNWASRNPDKMREYRRAWVARNPEKDRASKIEYKRINFIPRPRPKPRLEAELRGDIRYTSVPCKHGHNGERYTSSGQCIMCWPERWKSKFRSRQATPEWLTDRQREEMSAMYLRAEYLTKATRVKFEVDHVIPLRGKLVWGLHVPWNMQVIPRHENRRKSNKCR